MKIFWKEMQVVEGGVRRGRTQVKDKDDKMLKDKRKKVEGWREHLN